MNSRRLALVRTVHTAIYLVMASSVFVVLYAGVTGARSTLVSVALALVAVESIVFVSNGFACPFTALAAKYRGGEASAPDTYLPERFTRRTFQVFGPLIVIGLSLLVARWLGVLT
jgi:hypothetical protein